MEVFHLAAAVLDWSAIFENCHQLLALDKFIAFFKSVLSSNPPTSPSVVFRESTIKNKIFIVEILLLFLYQSWSYHGLLIKAFKAFQNIELETTSMFTVAWKSSCSIFSGLSVTLAKPWACECKTWYIPDNFHALSLFTARTFKKLKKYSKVVDIYWREEVMELCQTEHCSRIKPASKFNSF